MEPVEIDFIYGGNTDTEGKKIEQSMENITAASKKAQAQAQAAVKEQMAVVKQIEADIKDIEKKVSQAAPGNAKSALIDELNGAKRALAEEKAALNDVQTSIENTAQGHVRLRTQVMEAKQALSELEMAGKRGTPEYAAAAKVLGDLNDQFRDTATQAKILADDESGFRAVAEVASGVAGGFAAATGVMALFGSENEDLARIQTRLQAVMAITIGLQEVATMVNKDSYFSVVILTRAKEMWAATNLKVAATLGVTTAAAGTLLAVITGGLIFGFIALYAAYDKWNEKIEENKKAAQEAAKVQEKAASDLAEGYAAERSKIDALITSIRSENVSRQDKLKMINQLKSIIPGYTAELSKEGTVIRENKKAIDDYMISLEKSLKLKGAEKELEAIYTKIYSLQKTVADSNGKLDGKNQFTNNLAEQGEVDLQVLSSQIAKKQIANKIFPAAIAELQKEADKIKEYISQTGLISGDIIKPDKSTNEKATKEIYDSEKAITDLILDIKTQRTKLELNQQSDSLQKRLAAIDLERDEEIRKIEEKKSAIVAAYNKAHKDDKGFIAKTSLSQIDDKKTTELAGLKYGITQAYSDAGVAETKKYGQEITDLVMQYAEERVKIAYDYDKKIQELAQNGLIVQAAALETEKKQKISEVSKGIIEESNLYKMATSDQLNISKALTAKLIEELKKRIEADKTLSQTDRDKMLADLKKAEYTVNKTDNPFADLIDGVEKYRKAREEQSRTNTQDDIENFAMLENAANEANRVTLEAASGALQGIGNILRDVTSQIEGLTDAEKQAIAEVEGLIEGASTLATGLATDDPAAILQGSIGILSNLYKLLDTQAKEVEKQLQNNKKAVDELNIAYENLNDAIDKAFGTEKARLIQEQIALLEKKKAIIEESMQAELNKDANYRKPKWWEYAIPGWGSFQVAKGLFRPKTDDAAISQYTAEINKIEQELAQLAQDAIIEAISGTSVMSAIDEFANAYADAFTSGEDAALKSADVVRNILKTALIEKLKQDLAPGIRTLMNMVSNAMADGFLSDQEKADIYAQNQKNTADAQANQEMFDQLGLGTSKQKGIQGDVKNMTEETGSALTGQIVAMRLNVAALLANSKSSLDIISRQLAVLEAIKTNTDRLNRIDDTLYYIKQNGIKVL